MNNCLNSVTAVVNFVVRNGIFLKDPTGRNAQWCCDTVVLSLYNMCSINKDLVFRCETKLQNLLNSVVTESELNGLTLNKKKSVCMVFSKSTVQLSCNIRPTVNGEKINQVEQFSYLGSLVTHDGRCDKEIRRRIGIAKSVFRSMEKV